MTLTIELSNSSYKFLEQDAKDNGFSSIKEYVEEIVYDYYHARKDDDHSKEYKKLLNDYMGGKYDNGDRY